MKLVGADGKPLGLKGTAVVELELRIKNVSKKVKHRVAIVENLTAPMLIGLELMKELQICIDIPNLELRFARNGSKGGIRVVRDEVMPSRSQVLHEAQVNLVRNILAVPLMMESGLTVANSVARVERNKIPIVVLNPFNKDLKIERGTKLASAQTLDEDEPSESASETVIGRVVEVNGMQEAFQVRDGLTDEQVAQLDFN